MAKDHNWAKCPRCDGPDIEALKKGLNETYGTIPTDEWVALYKRAEQAEDRFTLIEYSEVGANEEGELELKYEAKCTLCGFRYEMDYKKDLTGDLETTRETASTYGNDINRFKRLCAKMIHDLKRMIQDPPDSSLPEYLMEAGRLGVDLTAEP